MSRLFLSYSRADAADATRLRDALQAKGHDVWMDSSRIQSGAQWRKSIVEAIEKADRVLLLLSGNSIHSDNVRREIDIAQDAAVPILPLMLGEVDIPTSLRYQIAGIQRHNLSHDFEAGVQSLLELLAQVDGEIAPDNSASVPRTENPILGTWIGRFGFLTAMVLTAIALYASTSRSPDPAGNSAGTLASSPLAVYLLLCAGIFALFQMTESLLRRPVLDEIGDWLMGDAIDGERADRPQGFISMFDAVFGVRHVSKRLEIPGFWRSAAVSVSFALLLYGMFNFAGVDLITKELGPTYIDRFAPAWASALNGILLTVVLSLLFNVVPDYVSIIESRYVLAKIEELSRPGPILLILVLDTVFTICIAFVGSAVANVLSPLASFVLSGDLKDLVHWEIPFGIEHLLQVYAAAFGLYEPTGEFSNIERGANNYCMVFIYSTFFTSAWIWLYLGAGLVVRAGRRIERLRRLLLGPFRVKERPLSVLGWLCILVASVGFWSIQLSQAKGLLWASTVRLAV